MIPQHLSGRLVARSRFLLFTARALFSSPLAFLASARTARLRLTERWVFEGSTRGCGLKHPARSIRRLRKEAPGWAEGRSAFGSNSWRRPSLRVGIGPCSAPSRVRFALRPLTARCARAFALCVGDGRRLGAPGSDAHLAPATSAQSIDSAGSRSGRCFRSRRARTLSAL
jgi:hypothetical protein